MCQLIFGKVDEFGWWDLEIIQTDDGLQFTSKYFQGSLSVHVIRLTLVEPDHQEINVQFEVTLWTLQTISHSIMMKTYIFSFIHTSNHIFHFLPTKHFVN